MSQRKSYSQGRLLIECTYVFEHPQDNSGIQRVVRNIIKNLGACADLAECVPVVFLKGEIYEVVSLAPVIPKDNWLSRLNRWRIRFAGLHSRYWNLYSAIHHRSPALLRTLMWALFKLGSYPVRLPGKLLEFSRSIEMLPERVRPLSPREGDTLVLLDSSWHGDFFGPVRALKDRGTGVVNVVYDLIPVTNPEFCDAGLVRVFEQWVEWMTTTGDGYVCISATIMRQLQSFIADKHPDQDVHAKWFRHFRLGSDLDLATHRDLTSPEVVEAFSKNASCYLMVSTLEPRKNHTYLLDAFEILWQESSQARLVIIGKIGWKVDALIERIKSHPEFGKRLYMFNHLGDGDLEFAYRHSRALLFPSFVEGFGLPIVEAMQRGLPAMVSDIPVFQEIAGNHAAYFDLERPATLATMIREFDSSGTFPAEAPVDGFQWLSWQQSSREFVSIILDGLRGAHRSHAAPGR